LKAFNLYGQQLTQEAIEEALLDASLHMGRTANALFERKKNEIQSMKPIPPCFTSQPIPAQSELSSQLEEIQREAKHQLRQELTKQMYERRGHEHLASKAQASASTSGTVFHGDQINNYGQAGAIGRHSQGVVNLNERWKEIEQDTDLQVLALELDRLRTAYRKVASSREDDKQVALLGDAEEEAEKGNGRNMAAILSKVGRNVLNVAKDIGTDVAAKVIVELMKAD
jgi:hypothetical protein